jgi:small GTP-binding protein
MGGTINKAKEKVTKTYKYLNPQKFNIIMLGLESAGKTTLLYQITLGMKMPTIPTTGYNQDDFYHPDLQVTLALWDVSLERDAGDKYTKDFFKEKDGIIFVVDANNRSRIRDAQEDLRNIIKNDEEDRPLLICANKQDYSGAMKAEEISEALKLETLTRKYHVAEVSAAKGTGVREAATWMVKACMERANNNLIK